MRKVFLFDFAARALTGRDDDKLGISGHRRMDENCKDVPMGPVLKYQFFYYAHP
ncbi:MAG: hypothetical protein NTX36_14900 [Proteobacteria bacterium]|nr:hypothetical protein [Pseudomonadota bacterium]